MCAKMAHYRDALKFPKACLSPSPFPPHSLRSPSVVPPNENRDLKCAILAQFGVSWTPNRKLGAGRAQIGTAGFLRQ